MFESPIAEKELNEHIYNYIYIKFFTLHLQGYR